MFKVSVSLRDSSSTVVRLDTCMPVVKRAVTQVHETEFAHYVLGIIDTYVGGLVVEAFPCLARNIP
jgi:hypothetical protein